MQESLFDKILKEEITLEDITKENSFALIGKFNNVYSRRFSDLYYRVSNKDEEPYWFRQTVQIQGALINKKTITVNYVNDTLIPDSFEVNLSNKKVSLEYSFNEKVGLYLVTKGMDFKNEIALSTPLRDYSFI